MEVASLTPGTQALRRGLELLRVLGQHQHTGLRLSDVTRLTGLERSTAHRLLSCLVEEEFAERNALSKRYRLGMDAMHLGSAAVRKLPLVDRFRPMMQRLARVSGNTVFLVVRDGDEAVCLHREAGPLPIKVFTIDVGARRLLGIGAGGLAMLSQLDDAEIGDIHARHRAAYGTLGLDQFSLMRAVRDCRARTHSLIVDITAPGVVGIGAALPASVRVQAAMSIGTTTMGFTTARRTELAALLAAAVHEIEDRKVA